MKAVRLLCLTALVVPTVALAQANADKARLDDFAAPQATDGIEIGQIASPRGPVVIEQSVDRTLAAPQKELVRRSLALVAPVAELMRMPHHHRHPF